eukprot:NODE_12356_length_1229_cov_5.227768.p1 GENE.NODE_12356_length_1229_cov_5.227768~~NODE_12356_length_1229_cov_5.227768.p1  ORF type:complete len:268 (-),score=63.52 NODE_12356_length_1229_cov_5.227768:204-1007(-)
MRGRAAGGYPVQDFKLGCILRALDEVPQGSLLVWTDVDVQSLVTAPALRRAIEAAMSAAETPEVVPADAGSGVAGDSSAATPFPAHVLFQREFADCGVNVGFMVLRAAPPTCALVRKGRELMAKTRALDQKVFNRMLVDGTAFRECGARCARLPLAFWSSSSCFGAAKPRPPLRDLCLHHANFVSERGAGGATDPAPKLAQLSLVAGLHRNFHVAAATGDSSTAKEAEERWAQLCDSIADDVSIARYRERHFPISDADSWLRVPTLP